MIQPWRDLLRALTDVAGAQCDDCANKRQHRCLRQEVRDAVAAFKARPPAHEDAKLVAMLGGAVFDAILCVGANQISNALRFSGDGEVKRIRAIVGRMLASGIEINVIGAPVRPADARIWDTGHGGCNGRGCPVCCPADAT